MQIAVLLLLNYLINIILAGNILYKGVRHVRVIEIRIFAPWWYCFSSLSTRYTLCDSTSSCCSLWYIHAKHYVLWIACFWSQWLRWCLAARSLLFSICCLRLIIEALSLFPIEISSSLVVSGSWCIACFAENLIVVQWLYLNELDSVIWIWMEPDNWLEAIWIHTRNLSNHSHFHILSFIFRNCHVRRWVMLFVTHQDVRDQGTFTGQERDSQFDSLSMPILRIFSLEFDPTDRFIELVKKSEFSSHAEVWYSEEA